MKISSGPRFQDVKYFLSWKGFEKKFKPILREIDYVKLKIHKKKGFWFLKQHVYTEQDLLDSPHFCKIDSIIEKIGSDVESWHKNGKLSLFDRQVYQEYRDATDLKLEGLKKEIIARQPTWWENFRSVFEGFIGVVMGKLPDLALSFLPPVIEGLVKGFLPGRNKEQARLPPGFY